MTSGLARRLVGALLIAWCGLLSTPVRSEEPSCENPGAATASLLDWLQPDHYDPVRAAACLDLPPGKADRGPQLAVQLKAVLDARGLYVPVSTLPTEPDHTDERGRNRLQPLDALPALVLVKKGDRWLYSQETVASVPALYGETFSGLSLAFQERLPPLFFETLFGLFLWQYLYFGLLLLAALAAGRLAQVLLGGQVVRTARRFGVRLSDSVVAGTRRPVTLAAVGAVLLWGVPDLQLPVRPSQALLLGARVLLLLAAVLVLLRVVDVFVDFTRQRALQTESRIDDQVVPLLDRAAKVLVVALGVVFVLQNLGVDVGGLVAGLGIGGLALALAAKDTLENFFGSLVIFTDRPFQVGDWVVVDGSTEGVVEQVGFRCTRIRTFYNSVVTVPNGKVATSRVDNMGQRHFRRIKATLGLTYDTPPDRVEGFVDAIRAYLGGHPAVARTTCEIHFHTFSASSLDVMLYYFLDVPDWSAELATRQEHFLHFMKLAESMGIAFAFPSTSLYVEKLPPAS